MARELKVALGQSAPLTALLERPAGARCLLVLGPGAGAPMRHPFLEAAAAALARHDVATLRYQFPYQERGGRRPDAPPRLLATLRAAVCSAVEAAPDLPLLAGGKSMGGRISSLAAADDGLPPARGLVFFGFPLHAAGRPDVRRAEPLARVRLPMLFLQGTRDRLADLELLRPICSKLGRRATLHVVEGADHGFHMLRRSGRSDASVIEELAERVARWWEAQASWGGAGLRA